MSSGTILSLSPYAGRGEPAPAAEAPQSPAIVKLAAQVRGLCKGNKKVVLFTRVGADVQASTLVEQIAHCLYGMDRERNVVLTLFPGNGVYATGETRREAAATPAEPASVAPTLMRPAPQIQPGVHLLNLLDMSSKKELGLADAIAQLRAQSDCVLIDAPALLQSALTPLAVEAADSVILLVQQGASSLDEAAETRLQLQRMGASIAGFVFLEQERGGRRSKP